MTSPSCRPRSQVKLSVVQPSWETTRLAPSYRLCKTLNILPRTPACHNLANIPSSHTVEKALNVSTNNMYVSFPSALLPHIIWCSMNWWSAQLLPGLNPFWPSCNLGSTGEGCCSCCCCCCCWAFAIRTRSCCCRCCCWDRRCCLCCCWLGGAGKFCLRNSLAARLRCCCCWWVCRCCC